MALGVRLRKPNVGAPSWRSMTTGMRGKRILIRRQFLFEALEIVNIAKGSLLQEIDLILR